MARSEAGVFREESVETLRTCILREGVITASCLDFVAMVVRMARRRWLFPGQLDANDDISPRIMNP